MIGKPKPGKSIDMIDQYGLMPHIDFVSGVTDERIVELYSEAELAVVPSLYEGFSLPAIEAMCSGTPLVATDGGALPEVTGTDGETVFRCRKGDAGDLARARSVMPSRTPSCGRRSAKPAASACSSGGRGAGAPSSPSSSTARCSRCPRTSPSCAATAGSDSPAC
jgi:glycosyltransferase involved in cell wall biosynthesis